jgi:hypothetical protein
LTLPARTIPEFSDALPEAVPSFGHEQELLHCSIYKNDTFIQSLLLRCYGQLQVVRADCGLTRNVSSGGRVRPSGKDRRFHTGLQCGSVTVGGWFSFLEGNRRLTRIRWAIRRKIGRDCQCFG